MNQNTTLLIGPTLVVRLFVSLCQYPSTSQLTVVNIMTDVTPPLTSNTSEEYKIWKADTLSKQATHLDLAATKTMTDHEVSLSVKN